MSNRRRNHTREFKLQCCRQIATGEKRPAQICRVARPRRDEGITKHAAFDVGDEHPCGYALCFFTRRAVKMLEG